MTLPRYQIGVERLTSEGCTNAPSFLPFGRFIPGRNPRTDSLSITGRARDLRSLGARGAGCLLRSAPRFGATR